MHLGYLRLSGFSVNTRGDYENCGLTPLRKLDPMAIFAVFDKHFKPESRSSPDTFIRIRAERNLNKDTHLGAIQAIGLIR